LKKFGFGRPVVLAFPVTSSPKFETMRADVRKSILYFLLLTTLVTAFSCDKKDTNDDTTPPTPTGVLSGTVQTWDDKLNQTTDAGGITVSILSATDSSSTTTDATGKFQFDKLPFGTYTLVFSKVGYGTMKMFGISHAANTTPTIVPNINFGKIAATAVTRLTYYDSVFQGQPGVRLRYGFTPGPSATNTALARYFLGIDSTVSSTHYTTYDTTLYKFGSYSVKAGYTFSDLKKLGFTAGQTVYIRLYADSYINNSYVDSTTGLRVFPNVNPRSPKPVPEVLQ
jgi:hypothetical protein